MSAEPSASEILAGVRSVYAGCRTYQDTGTETTSFVDDHPAPRQVETKLFSTAFVRPDRFRFQCKTVIAAPEEEWEHMLILRNADVVRASSRFHKRAQHYAPVEVFTLLAGSVGVFVFTLLTPSPKTLLPTVESTSILCREPENGCECIVLAGCLWDASPQTMWIGRDDLLVRRIDRVAVFDERWHALQAQRCEQEMTRPLSKDRRKAFEQVLEHLSRPHVPYRTETTITYEPVLDPAIPAEAFATPSSWG